MLQISNVANLLNNPQSDKVIRFFEPVFDHNDYYNFLKTEKCDKRYLLVGTFRIDDLLSNFIEALKEKGIDDKFSYLLSTIDFISFESKIWNVLFKQKTEYLVAKKNSTYGYLFTPIPAILTIAITGYSENNRKVSRSETTTKLP